MRWGYSCPRRPWGWWCRSSLLLLLRHLEGCHRYHRYYRHHPYRFDGTNTDTGTALTLAIVSKIRDLDSLMYWYYQDQSATCIH